MGVLVQLKTVTIEDIAQSSKNATFFSPTAGALTKLTGEVVLPPSELQYYKINAQYQRFFPLTQSFTLMVNGELGYGDGDEATIVSYGLSSSAKYITTYFRLAFNVPDPSLYAGLTINLLRDDGAVVYLNGQEVRRDNLPSGAITYTTLATTALGAPEEATFYPNNVPASYPVAGNNVLAVELHQANGTSSDISFDLELSASTGPTVIRGPYLQSGTPTSVIVRWRTDAATAAMIITTASLMSMFMCLPPRGCFPLFSVRGQPSGDGRLVGAALAPVVEPGHADRVSRLAALDLEGAQRRPTLHLLRHNRGLRMVGPSRIDQP